MKENYTDKVDKLITELKKTILKCHIVDCIRELKPISKSEVRTALMYAGIKPSKEDYKLISEVIEKK